MKSENFNYPTANRDTEPYWHGLRRRQLLYQWCGSCEKAVFHPRAACPYCWQGSLQWRSSCGIGRIYSFSETWRGPEEGCNIFAIVELLEDFFMFGQVQAKTGEIAIGTLVKVIYEDVTSDLTLAKFRRID